MAQNSAAEAVALPARMEPAFTPYGMEIVHTIMCEAIDCHTYGTSQ